eukprot:2652648-Pleurochrysis_carterae.AAC.1
MSEGMQVYSDCRADSLACATGPCRSTRFQATEHVTSACAELARSSNKATERQRTQKFVTCACLDEVNNCGAVLQST